MKSETEKEKAIIEFIKELKTIELAMEPFKESKRELKKAYIDEKGLTKYDISSAVKAYRMISKEEDIEELVENYKLLRREKYGLGIEFDDGEEDAD